MNAKEINFSFDLVSYISDLVSLRKVGEYHVGPCPICGGKDRFNLKRTRTGDAWICRKCAPEKYHSAINFVMAYHQLDFKQALEKMGGDIQPLRGVIGKGKPALPPVPLQVLPDPAWQEKAWALVESAARRLLEVDDFDCLFACNYLQERGIDRGSICRDWLGYVEAYKRPAIVIPWMDLGHVVTAVKFRFIDELANQDKGRRFAMMAGSMPYLFGLQNIQENDDTLLFVEGELNAISLLQTLPRGVSVISAGADTNGNAALLRALARHYSRVIVWTDDPAKGRTIRERMERPEARILKSPVINGEKWDANRMLQAGLLMEFISAELATNCQGIPVSTSMEI